VAMRVLATIVFGLILVGGTAVHSGAQQPKDGQQATNGQLKKQAKKCRAGSKSARVKERCQKRQAPKLTRNEAIGRALDLGRIEAKRRVTVSRATRTGRSTFSVVVAWTKRPPIGTQDCSLELSISKKRPRTFVTAITGPGCGFIKEHRDLSQRFQLGPGPKYCPSNVENSWNAKSLEGKTYEEAQAIAAENGCELRVVRQDGVDLVVTMDFSHSRLNVEVEGPDLRVVRILSVT